MGVRACAVHHAAYRILRQSRPSLRRWTASSSGWPSPRPRRRRLPPAAARLETTAGPRGRGQHSAAAPNNGACGPTLRTDDATPRGGSSASASLRTAPERDARPWRHTAAESGGTEGSGAIGWESGQSRFGALWLVGVLSGAGHVVSDRSASGTESRQLNWIKHS